MTDSKKLPTEKTIAKRTKQKENLTIELKKQLKKNFDLHNGFEVRFHSNVLDIFILKEENHKLFGSDIEFRNRQNLMETESNLEINFASSGSFSPSDLAPFVRTKHAMEFLGNWKKAEEIILGFMNQLKRIEDTWRFENNLLNS